MSAIKSCGLFRADVDGREVELSNDDLLISMKNKEGYSSESDGETTVVLDTQLTDDLIFEGAEREIVSKIQTMRKEAGFEVTDHILVGYKAEGVALQVFEKPISSPTCFATVSRPQSTVTRKIATSTATTLRFR